MSKQGFLIGPALRVVFVSLFVSLAAWAQAPDINDTKLLAQPAIGKSHIAFVYAGDLWTADLNGKNVRRMTSDDGVQSSPAFSPDGTLIAFTAQYDGNLDVYVMPSVGGVPTRLTWH